MKKYLKKALSALIALAVAGSMIPASFAAKVELTDVAGTTYETAINTLVSLGIIDGFPEDNTFRPDELITREQTAKVVVAALNQIESAEAMAGKTEFSDVAADKWSSGYVNAGVQEGFINGMGDGTFAPTENVTFAQMVKMLVSVLGYDAHADYMGGWPNGFVSIAKSEGVADGVKANNNDQVTRGQVAQLVYNALNTPIVKEGALKFDSKGEPYAELTIMNGEDGNYYKTLLTEKFDAFTVEGTISGSFRTGDTAEPGLIDFTVAATENYNSDIFGEDGIDADNVLADIDVADTDAENYVGTYGTAIIVADEFDDLSLLSFAASGKNKTVEFDASLLDISAWDADDNGVIDDGATFNVTTVDALKFYATESATKSTEYELEVVKNDSNVQTGLNVALYVNGVKMTASNLASDMITYVLKNTNGTIKLVDTYKSTKGYDAIYVSYYATASVSSVNAKTGKIVFGMRYVDGAVNAGGNIVLDDEREDLVYTITLNGEKVNISAIEKDDILTIAYDVTAAYNTSNFYDIYVSRDVQTGSLSKLDTEKKSATIGGVAYSFVAFNNTSLETNITKDDLNNEYTIYNDYFGKVFRMEINASAVRYAIIDRFYYSTTKEEWIAQLYTTDGALKEYLVDMDKVGGTAEALKAKVYSSGETKKDVLLRVVEYEIATSTGYIKTLNVLPLTTVNSILSGSGSDVVYNEFDEAKSRIGSVKMGSATNIIDAVKYAEDGYKGADLAVTALGDLADGKTYGAYAYGAKLSDGTYPFVIIKTSGAGEYNESTRLAIITGNTASAHTDENGVEYYAVDAYAEGAETELKFNDDEVANALTRGDVILVKETDSNGYIEAVDTIYSADNLSTPATFVSDALATVYTTSTVNGKIVVGYSNDDMTINVVDPYDAWYSSDSDAMQVVFGPVVGVTSNDISIGTIAPTDGTGIYTNLDAKLDGTVNGAVVEVGYSEDTNVYAYRTDADYSFSKRFILDGSLAASTIIETEKDNGDEYVYWTGDNADVENIAFALALVVDGEAVDVLVFSQQ